MVPIKKLSNNQIRALGRIGLNFLLFEFILLGCTAGSLAPSAGKVATVTTTNLLLQLTAPHIFRLFLKTLAIENMVLKYVGTLAFIFAFVITFFSVKALLEGCS